jgi:hypothetical protein
LYCFVARRPSHLDSVERVFRWSLDAEAMRDIDGTVAEHVVHPIVPKFMAPPAGPAIKAVA